MAQLARVRYEVLRALIMKTAIFWNVSPHGLVELYRRFIQICCLQHPGQMNTPSVDNSMNTHTGWTKTELWPGNVISTPPISIQNFIMILMSNVQLNTLSYISRGLPYYRLQ